MQTYEHSRPAVVIKQLGDEIFRYSDEFGTQRGKFIRIGDLVVVGPYASEPKLRLLHVNLVAAAAEDADLQLQADNAAAIARQQGETTLIDSKGVISRINDAGHFIALSLGGDQGLVQVFGDSVEYGRADAAGRELTSEVFTRVLGATAMIATDA